MDVVSSLPQVAGELVYLAKTGERPHTYTYDPPDGTPKSNIVTEAHTVPVFDMRPVADGLSLDVQGFALVDAPTAVADFYDEAALRATYYQPASRAHVDQTVLSGPQRVRDLMGAEADDLLTRRFAIVNVWRPIRGPLYDAPLAVCDAASVKAGDLVAQDLIYRDRRGEIYGLTFNLAHRWYYAPAMQANEALLLKCYDSAKDGRARFMPHTAFEDPTAPADRLPRESIELRTLVFFDA